MRLYVVGCVIVAVVLYAQTGVDTKILKQENINVHKIATSNPHNFPVEVKVNPDIQIKTGTPPVLPTLNLEKIKENLKPQTAKKITNVKYKRVGKLKEISYSRAEALASYKAMLQKQLAEMELKGMMQSGATDEEIEAFKMATDERILQTRLEIMKQFGTEKEIKETEEAILKFNIYKNLKAKEER